MVKISEWLMHAQSSLVEVSDTSRLDSEVLLAHAFGQNRSWIITHSENSISQETHILAESLLQRAREGEPLPYVLGHWEFFGLEFFITPDVLIPRPETELLVESAVHWLEKHPTSRRIIDVGTGSGCIAICLAKRFPDSSITATDLSSSALLVAKKNCQKHRIDNISLVHSDLLLEAHGKFDLIVANLPYIPNKIVKTLMVARHEPLSALDGGVEGLQVIENLLRMAPNHLQNPGMILLEIDSPHCDEVTSLTKEYFPSTHIDIIEDLSHNPRVVCISTGK